MDDTTIAQALDDLVQHISLPGEVASDLASRFGPIRRKRQRRSALLAVGTAVAVVGITASALIAVGRHHNVTERVSQPTHNRNTTESTTVNISFSRVPDGLSVGTQRQEALPAGHGVESSVALTSPDGALLKVYVRTGADVQPVKLSNYIDANPKATYVTVGDRRVLALDRTDLDYQWTYAPNMNVEVIPLAGGSQQMCFDVIRDLKINAP